MQVVTVNIPSVYLDALAKLTEQGLFPSRSEAVRVALHDFLKVELSMVNTLLDLNDKDQPVVPRAERPAPPKKIDMRTIRAGWAR